MLEQLLDWSEEARGAPKEGTDKTRLQEKLMRVTWIVLVFLVFLMWRGCFP